MNRPPTRKWLIFSCVALGTFMAYLDSSIVNIALPTVARQLGADLSVIEWVVTSYLLMITGLVIVFGRLADLHGRKRLYLFGFVAFTVGSALCAAAPGVWVLVAFRCVQGIGAAALLANGTAIITEAFPSHERGKALGLMGSVLALGAIAGPLVGGFLSEHVGWRSVFYVNVPIGIGGLLLSTAALPASTGAKARERFDAVGGVTLIAALGGFLLLVTLLSKPEPRPLASLALLSAVVALGAVFFSTERRIEHPLVDLTLFSRRAFSAALASSYLSFWALASVSFLLPFYLDVALRLKPSQAGYILAPVPVVLVVVAPLGGLLADRFGARVVCTAGACINCFGLASLGTLALDTTPLGVVLRLVPLGIGMGLFQPPNSSAIMGAVPAERLGIASGMISAIKNLGSMSGVAVTSLIFTVAQSVATGRHRAAGAAMEAAERASYVSAVRFMYLFSAAVCSIAIATSLVRTDVESRGAGAR